MYQTFRLVYIVFFFNDTATTEIYTLSLHDALPIWPALHDARERVEDVGVGLGGQVVVQEPHTIDRKSTRLNSSHVAISYAVFCLKKKIEKFRRNKSIDPNPH